MASRIQEGGGGVGSSGSVRVVKPSKDTQGRMDAIRTKEGLIRQENARINKAAQRLLDKTGKAVVDQSRAGARTNAGITGKSGFNVSKMFGSK